MAAFSWFSKSSSPEEDSDSDFLISDKIEQFSLGHMSSRVYSSSQHSWNTQEDFLLEQLPRCQTPKTLEEHAKFIAKSSGEVELENITQQLQEMKEAKLLLSTQEIYESWKENNSCPEDDLAISSLAIITHNRPKALQDCFQSYWDHLVEKEHSGTIFVLDGSEGENLAQNQNFLSSQKEHPSLKLCHVSQKEKRIYIDRLKELGSKEGVPPEVVEFTLHNMQGWGRDVGTKRNLFLLATVGEKAISVDDDTICQFHKSPSYEDKIDVCARIDHTEVRFYPTFEEISQSHRDEEFDLLKGHNSFLGKKVQNVIGQLPQYQNWEKSALNPEFLVRLLKTPQHISVISTGLAGDSGTDSPSGILGLQGENRKRLFESEETYQNVLARCPIMKSVPRWVLTSSNHFMTPNASYDNRQVLPPFSPVVRNQDQVFATLLQKTEGSTQCIGHMPWAIYHYPEEKRSFSREDLVNCRFSLGGILPTFISEFCESSINPSLEQVGTYLKDLGKLSSTDFEATLASSLVKLITERISYLGIYLQVFQRTPEYWARDVEEQIEKRLDFLEKKDFFIPEESKIFGEKALLETQNFFQLMGDLLIHWKSLRSLAYKLKEEGKGLDNC